MREKPTLLRMRRLYRSLNPGEVAGFRDEAEIKMLLDKGIAVPAAQTALQAVVSAGMLETRTAAPDDGLDGLDWGSLMTRAKLVSENRGEQLDEAAGGRSKAALIAYLRKYEG